MLEEKLKKNEKIAKYLKTLEKTTYKDIDEIQKVLFSKLSNFFEKNKIQIKHKQDKRIISFSCYDSIQCFGVLTFEKISQDQFKIEKILPEFLGDFN